ncbi:hypothetical protein JL721_8760 [Aureococcus anophagefferens]|nr:hypothetical protein JL721_8760 [Aureococcus anophagefferens]
MDDAISRLRKADKSSREKKVAALHGVRRALKTALAAEEDVAESLAAYGEVAGAWAARDGDDVVEVVAVRSLAWLAARARRRATSRRRRRPSSRASRAPAAAGFAPPRRVLRAAALGAYRGAQAAAGDGAATRAGAFDALVALPTAAAASSSKSQRRAPRFFERLFALVTPAILAAHPDLLADVLGPCLASKRVPEKHRAAFVKKLATAALAAPPRAAARALGAIRDAANACETLKDLASTCSRLEAIYRNRVCAPAPRAPPRDDWEGRAVELIRALAEMIIYGERHSEAFFEYFVEKQMMGLLVALATAAAPRLRIQVQVLQTVAILVQNVRHKTSLYLLLSSNYVNALLGHGPFRRRSCDEELFAHFVSLLKTLSLRLDAMTAQFFAALAAAPAAALTRRGLPDAAGTAAALLADLTTAPPPPAALFDDASPPPPPPGARGRRRGAAARRGAPGVPGHRGRPPRRRDARRRGDARAPGAGRGRDARRHAAALARFAGDDAVDDAALSSGRVLCAADVRAVAAAVDRANGTKLDVVVRAAAGAFVGLARRVAGDDGDVQKWALSLVFESERNCTVAHHFLRDKRSVARAKRRDDLRAQLAELTMDV